MDSYVSFLSYVRRHTDKRISETSSCSLPASHSARVNGTIRDCVNADAMVEQLTVIASLFDTDGNFVTGKECRDRLQVEGRYLSAGSPPARLPTSP